MTQKLQLEGTVFMHGINNGKPWSCVQFSTPEPRYFGLPYNLNIAAMLPLSTKVSVVVSTEDQQGEDQHE